MKPTAKSSTVCEKCCQREERLAGRRVAGRQERVGGDDAGEAIGMLADEPQADEATPVLADERDVAQVERVEERGAHPLDVARRRCSRSRAVGLSERPKPTRSGATQRSPAAGEHRDHLAVQVAPRRLAVHQQHDRRVARALVEVVDAQRAVVAGRDLDVVRREREAGQVGEAVVGGAE